MHVLAPLSCFCTLRYYGVLSRRTYYVVLKMNDDNRTLEQMREELALYEKAYRALLDQLNALEPDLRAQQLRQALVDERDKRRRISQRLKQVLDELARYKRGEQTDDPVARSIRRHQKRRRRRGRRR